MPRGHGGRTGHVGSAAVAAAHSLTRRELEVLRLLASDSTDCRIACKRVVSPWTVRNCVRSMRHKLEQPDPRRAVLAVARAGIVELRESCGPLQPPGQITHLVRSGGARLADNLPARAPLAVKITLFRALEEALSNATRHGGGVGVRVHVEGQADGLSLTVSDQGPGFAPEAVPAKGHLGLANLRERAELLGGSFHVTLAPGRGTTLVLWMPLGADGEET